jgi:hypothetical protein
MSPFCEHLSMLGIIRTGPGEDVASRMSLPIKSIQQITVYQARIVSNASEIRPFVAQESVYKQCRTDIAS